MSRSELTSPYETTQLPLLFSKQPPWTLVRPKNPFEARDASRNLWIWIFGGQKFFQIKWGGGEEMRFGRIFARSVALGTGFRERARTPGSWRNE